MAVKRSRAAFEADLQKQQSPYVFFGTPLPPLDPQVRDDGSYVPVWQQEVTDERGRKRLHGAFTGGFSAGYFNTVGSKEGWTPQSFVSSRSNRAKAAQRAEDFMDAEDLADADEARQLEAKAGFSALGSTADELGGKESFMDLFRPREETIGLKLLRRMGWKDGQGIGPKVRRKVKTHEPDDPGGGDSGHGGGDGNEVTHLMAPENSAMVSFARKTDTKGLGFNGEDSLDGSRGSSRPVTAALPAPDDESLFASISKKPKPEQKRGGFGMGVLNDNGSDEEDPYDMGPKLSYNRVMGGEKKKKKKAENGKPTMNSNPLLSNKLVFVKRDAKSSGFRRCHDGKLPLNGFLLSTKGPLTQERKYPLPEIPDGWVSSKQATSSTQSDPSTYQSSADLAKASTLDASARASILGEKMLPGKSVFDFLTPAARDKLAAASNKPDLPAAGSEALPPTTATTSSLAARPPSAAESAIPLLDAQVAVAALSRTTSGFVPYADNPAKLARYQAFLRYRAELPDAPMPTPATAAGAPQHDDFAAELREFAHAASIFKPMSGAMASRFTSSSSSSAPRDADATAATADFEGEAPLLRQPPPSLPVKELPPDEQAAKLGMFGPLTRTTSTFAPERLLCKRFGERPPAG